MLITSSFFEAKMYSELSKKLTNIFIKNNIIKEEQTMIFNYCFEVIISDVVYLTVFMSLSLITHSLIESLCFILGFILIRQTAGGYHASNYTKCHLLFSLNQIFMILCVKFINKKNIEYLVLIFLLTSIVVVFIFAPIKNKKNKHSVKQIKKLYYISRLLVLSILALTIVLKFVNKVNSVYFLSFMLGVFSVSISIIIENTKERRYKIE